MTQESTNPLSTILDWMTADNSTETSALNIGTDGRFLSEQTFDSNGEIAVMQGLKRTAKEISETDGVKHVQIQSNYDRKAVTADDVLPFSTLEEAESHVLGEAVFLNLSNPPTPGMTAEERFATQLRRGASNIATRTQRGRGNTFVFHPDNLETVKAALADQENARLVPNPRAALDRVLVLYQGKDQEDQPLIYVEGKGLILNSAFSDIVNYGKFVSTP